MYRAKHSYDIHAVEICSQSQLCLWGRINGSIKIMVLQIAQYTKFCSVFGIVSDRNNNNYYVLRFYRIRLNGLLGWSSLGISAISQLISLSSLEDQDKQQICFFVIRFTVKYSDRLVATASIKVLDFPCLKVLGSVSLSLRLCKTLVQFVTFMLFSGHLEICFTKPTAAVLAF